VILISSLALLLLLFPDGRLPSRRWRPVVWTLLVVDVSTWIGNTLVPGPFSRPLNRYDNPLGIGALRSAGAALSAPGWLIILVFAAGAVSLVRRFRAAEGDERLQYKWLTFAAALFPVAMLVTQLIDAFAGSASTADTLASTASGIVATAIPVATAVAVLRYRLYDIDRIVSRAVVYGALSALLAGAYVAIVLALEPAFGSLTHGSELAVGCSTLAVAWLFRPVRARVQASVDRRFYRSKTDVEETLARFGARLQREADLETLLAELDHVVRDALQPALIAVWLRNDPGTATQ
jgi:hypothetical protein